MLELGRAARAAAVVLAQAPAARSSAGCSSRRPRKSRGGERRDAARQCRGRRGGEEPRLDPLRCIDRLALDEKRIEATAAGLEAVAALDGSRRAGDRAVAAAERARDRARARAARRDRHHLREPAERDRRRGGVVLEERQRSDPARRLGERRGRAPRSTSVCRAGSRHTAMPADGRCRWCRRRIAKPSASCCAT